MAMQLWTLQPKGPPKKNLVWHNPRDEAKPDFACMLNWQLLRGCIAVLA